MYAFLHVLLFLSHDFFFRSEPDPPPAQGGGTQGGSQGQGTGTGKGKPKQEEDVVVEDPDQKKKKDKNHKHKSTVQGVQGVVGTENVVTTDTDTDTDGQKSIGQKIVDTFVKVGNRPLGTGMPGVGVGEGEGVLEKNSAAKLNNYYGINFNQSIYSKKGVDKLADYSTKTKSSSPGPDMSKYTNYSPEQIKNLTDYMLKGDELLTYKSVRPTASITQGTKLGQGKHFDLIRQGNWKELERKLKKSDMRYMQNKQALEKHYADDQYNRNEVIRKSEEDEQRMQAESKEDSDAKASNPAAAGGGALSGATAPGGGGVDKRHPTEKQMTRGQFHGDLKYEDTDKYSKADVEEDQYNKQHSKEEAASRQNPITPATGATERPGREASVLRALAKMRKRSSKGTARERVNMGAGEYDEDNYDMYDRPTVDLHGATWTDGPAEMSRKRKRSQTAKASDTLRPSSSSYMYNTPGGARNEFLAKVGNEVVNSEKDYAIGRIGAGNVAFDAYGSTKKRRM